MTRSFWGQKRSYLLLRRGAPSMYIYIYVYIPYIYMHKPYVYIYIFKHIEIFVYPYAIYVFIYFYVHTIFIRMYLCTYSKYLIGHTYTIGIYTLLSQTLHDSFKTGTSPNLSLFPGIAKRSRASFDCTAKICTLAYFVYTPIKSHELLVLSSHCHWQILSIPINIPSNPNKLQH
jgi:hypothetical protein